MPKPFDVRPRAPSRRLLTACACLFATAGFDAAAETLTLPQALSRAAAYDPALPAAARMRAAEAGVRQAGVRPNPSLGADLENFAGTGDIGLADRSEATLYYEQTWERGGKREARGRCGPGAELALARGRASVRALDLLAEVQTAWVEALAAEAAIAVAEERLAVARRLEGEVARRVRAARDPLFGERAGPPPRAGAHRPRPDPGGRRAGAGGAGVRPGRRTGLRPERLGPGAGVCRPPRPDHRHAGPAAVGDWSEI